MKPVTIPTHAFTFCRYSVAALIWLAWGFHSVWCLGAVLAVLVFSAILTVQRAPMIVLYSWTALRFYKSPEEVGVCLVGIWLQPEVGWRVTFLLALVKTVSALGFCPATKLYGCATNTTCCPVTKRFLGVWQTGKPPSPPK
jgi:hypothetical protein